MTEREQFEALADRIRDYLTSGGLFNPELADHMLVRDLLLECRDALRQAARAAVEWPGSYDAKGNPLGPHDNNDEVTVPHRMLSPTHFCEDCGALWRQCDDFSFNLRSEKACEACDNTPVGGQLIALTERAAAPASGWEEEARRYCNNAAYWRERAEKVEVAAPVEPVAWMHDGYKVHPGMEKASVDAARLWVISTAVKQLWLACKPKQVEHYTIPLYASPVRDEAWIALAMELADEYAIERAAATLVEGREAITDAARAALLAHLKSC